MDKVLTMCNCARLQAAHTEHIDDGDDERVMVMMKEKDVSVTPVFPTTSCNLLSRRQRPLSR